MGQWVYKNFQKASKYRGKYYLKTIMKDERVEYDKEMNELEFELTGIIFEKKLYNISKYAAVVKYIGLSLNYIYL